MGARAHLSPPPLPPPLCPEVWLRARVPRLAAVPLSWWAPPLPCWAQLRGGEGRITTIMGRVHPRPPPAPLARFFLTKKLAAMPTIGYYRNCEWIVMIGERENVERTGTFSLSPIEERRRRRPAADRARSSPSLSPLPTPCLLSNSDPFCRRERSSQEFLSLARAFTEFQHRSSKTRGPFWSS